MLVKNALEMRATADWFFDNRIEYGPRPARAWLRNDKLLDFYGRTPRGVRGLKRQSGPR